MLMTHELKVGDHVRLTRDLRHKAVKAGAVGTVEAVDEWSLFGTFVVTFPYVDFRGEIGTWRAQFERGTGYMFEEATEQDAADYEMEVNMEPA